MISDDSKTTDEIIDLAKLIARTPAAEIYGMGEAHPAGSEMRAIYFRLAAVVAQAREGKRG